MNYKFPTEAPKRKVIKTLNKLGFEIIREKEHISMIRVDSFGNETPLTLPNHKIINGALLRLICSQSGITREEFLNAFYS
jgi:predicted RNA binding protein YcfA (HicA-like mRNA interferase family)